MEKVHFAITRLMAAPEGWRSLVRDMVERWPDALATELIFAISSAASQIEATFGPGSPSREAAERGWRLAALIGSDLYAMQEIGLPSVRAGDLKAYWRIDPFFRTL